jgi:hypothetical protein
MGWVTTEMEDDYGQMKRETMFIPTSCAEATDHSRGTDLLDLKHAKDKLQDIDDQILKLAYEREYAISELEVVGNQVLGGWLCTSEALLTVANAYKHLGWRSKLACAFVERLRTLFFDEGDHPKAFKDIICYDIKPDNYLTDSSVKCAVNVVFGPKKYDCNKTFKIRLVGKGGMHFDWKGHFIETNIKVFKLNGGAHSWSEPMIARSPKLADIRAAICRFVMSGEYDELEFGPSERDNLQAIIGSLTSGCMRVYKAEKMFGYEGDNLLF